jgi:hypothetical protein
MSSGIWRRDALLLESSEAGSRTYSFRACSGVLPGRLPDTTTIALIARAAKRGGAQCASEWPRRVSGHTELPSRRKDKSFIFSTFTVAFGVPFLLMSQDIRRPGGHHDRHAQLRNACLYHPFCRGGSCGVSLDALAGDVRLDAPGDGPARECADAPSARDRAIGAGLCARALSAARLVGPGGTSPAANNLASRGSWSFSRRNSSEERARDSAGRIPGPTLAAELTVTPPPERPRVRGKGATPCWL